MSGAEGYSYGVEISIVEANGTEHSLADLAHGQWNGSKPSSQFVQFVASVEVEVSLFRFTQVRLSLRPTLAEAENLIRSEKLGLGFQFGSKTPAKGGGEIAKRPKNSFSSNTLKVRLWSGSGKDAQESPLFSGVLLAPEIQITPESINIDLRAVGLLNFSRQRGISKSFEGETHKKLLEDLLSDPENRYQIVANPDDAQGQAFLKKTFTGSLEGKSWDQAKDILRKENMRLIDVGIQGKDKKPTYEVVSYDFYAKRKDKTITFRAFKQVDFSNDVYPILEMKTSIVNYVAGQSLNRAIRAFRGDSKESVETNSTAEKKNKITQVSSTNGSVPGGPGGAPLSAPMRRGDSTEDQGGFLDKAIGMMNELTQSPLSYEIRSVGVPHLLPNRPVKVEIGGPRGNIDFLSNTYECSKVVHIWDSNGASTEVTLTSTFGLLEATDTGIIGRIESKLSGDSDE